MNLTIQEPIRLVKELKGAPLAVLILLSLNPTPVKQQWLEAHSGYSDKPVSRALAYLQEHGIALNARTRRLLGKISCDDILIVAQELSKQNMAHQTGLFVVRLEQRVALGMGTWEEVYGPPPIQRQYLGPGEPEEPATPRPLHRPARMSRKNQG